ncbi:MAG: PEP-CTERM sorting domain-containing protein [Planctomycetales bacterium]|nr:PEP-CTERM sorting domain-containing protein [Planctomycetales bacterium]
MKYSRHLILAAAAACLIGTTAEAASLTFSLGVRETGTTAAIGADGGTANGIEWIDLDAHVVNLDGTWQQVTIDLNNPQSVTGFAGSTADGVLASGKGTIENIRIKNADGIGAAVRLFLDDLVHTDVTGNPTTLGWEGLTVGDEYIFQEPSFSGSTSASVAAGSRSAVTDSMAHTGTQSYQLDFQFVNNDPSKWIRLTTFSAASIAGGSPTIELDSTISFWVKGGIVPEPTTMALAGLGVLGLAACRRRK